MRRLLPALAVILLLLCASAASADDIGGPVDPEHRLIEEHAMIDTGLRSSMRLLYSSSRAAPANRVDEGWDYSWSGSIGYNTTPTLTVIPPDDGTYYYEFYFGEYSSVFGSSWVVYRQRSSRQNTFTLCRIAVPDHYRLLVNIYDSTGSNRIARIILYDLYVEADPDHPALDEIVAGVVEEYRASSEYQTALNLHDWITHHMYYDSSLHYYGADGALVRGYGTCDSYSKAYYLLLQEAGITAVRISASNHAWVRICLDGEWYQVDVTWDDPVGATVPVSGSECHEYFCVTDEMMDASGHNYTHAPDAPCESLAMNYFVVTGGWQDAWNVAFLDELRAGLLQGRQGLGVPTPTGNYVTLRHYTILCYILNEQPQWMADASSEPLAFRYSYVDSVFAGWLENSGTVSGNWVYTVSDGGTAVQAWLGATLSASVPASLGGATVTALGTNFLLGNTRIVSLSLPASLTAIGPGALCGCTSLTGLDLPEGIALIGGDALPEGLVVSCAVDSSLAFALSDAGYSFLTPGIPDWTLIWAGEGTLCASAWLGDGAIVTLPAEITGLARLDAGTMRILTIPGAIAWCDTSAPGPSTPAVVVCADPTASLSAWCAINGVGLCAADGPWTLPASLSAIEAEAFTQSARGWIALPDLCESVGDRAFADCPGLWLVTVPSSVVSIGEDAFDPQIILLTPDGSPAALWADQNGLEHVSP